MRLGWEILISIRRTPLYLLFSPGKSLPKNTQSSKKIKVGKGGNLVGKIRNKIPFFQFSENKSIMNMKETFVINVFKYKDWEPLTVRGITQEFDTEEDAKTFVEKYPSFGQDWSRTIRQGNWQICQVEHN